MMPLECATSVTDRTALRSILWGLINFRGPALLADHEDAARIAHYSFFDLLLFGGADPRGAEARISIPRSSATKSCSSAWAPPVCSTCSKRRLPAARCLASRFTRRSPTISCPRVSCGPSRATVRIALVLTLALVVGFIAAHCCRRGGRPLRSRRSLLPSRTSRRNSSRAATG